MSREAANECIIILVVRPSARLNDIIIKSLISIISKAKTEDILISRPVFI